VGVDQQKAFDELKRLLCKATVEPLYIVDFTKPFDLYVDASAHSVSAVLTQKDPHGREVPVAFSSTKLTATQRAWSTIERGVRGAGCTPRRRSENSGREARGAKSRIRIAQH